MNKFIFDVDGTLTPSRQRIDPDFKTFFESFCVDNAVYLVTGSDYPKTVEQLGDRIVKRVKAVYNCSGNDVWQQGNNVRTSDWTMPASLHQMLQGWLQSSKFPLRTGIHIEERPGMVNFSIVGRGATQQQRSEYVEYDTLNRERESIAFMINNEFDNITATVGGETGIDIAPTGADKSQILQDFNLKTDKLYFFGDKTIPGGNDEPLAKLIKHSYQVNSWQNTAERLAYLQEAKLAS